MAYGLTVKPGHEMVRLDLSCPHQNGVLYAVPAEGSWVCHRGLLHAHALAGFLRELVQMEDPRVKALLQKWGLYYREKPLEEALQGEKGKGGGG